MRLYFEGVFITFIPADFPQEISQWITSQSHGSADNGPRMSIYKL